ncbi:MAG TPA: TIGR02996 domain-containing protein [Gemmata sp.]
MSDEDALLAAISAHPDEDTPRLAYADWLDEHGDPDRAEFIRLQIGLWPMMKAGAPAWPAVRERVEPLQAAHALRWAGSLVPLLPGEGVSFNRGFVDTIGVTDRNVQANWPQAVGRGMAEHPIRRVWLAGVPAADRGRLLDELPIWPQASVLRELQFIGGPPVTAGELAAIGGNPHLRRLTRLGLGAPVEVAALTALTREPLATHLTALKAQAPLGSAEPWCDALGGLLAGSPVEQLDIVTHDHDHSWIPVILNAVSGSRVTNLDLGFCWVRDDDLTTLARWPGAGELRALNLDDHHATPAGIGRLVADADLRSLARFSATPCWSEDMADAGVAWAALLAAPFTDRLTDLDVAFWGLADADFGPLGRGRLPNLQHFDLSYTGCGDAAATTVAGSAFVPQLRSLCLLECGITDAGAAALLGPDFPRLERLALSKNPIGDDVRTRLRARFGGRVELD